MKSNRIAIPLLAALLATPAAFAADDPTCNSVAECNQLGTKAYQAKNYETATTLFENQLAYAEEGGEEKQQLLALNNLALAALRSNQPLFARAWLKLAVAIKADDKATLFNQGEVDKAVAALPARPAIGGYYRAYAGAGSWQTIELKSVGKNRYSFEIFAMRLGNQWREWGPAGIGELTGEIEVKGNKAKFEEKMDYADGPCQFTFDFAGDEIDVEQLTPDYQCGFGNGVAATGHYYRTAAPPAQ